jgi:hypothetical protein
MGLVPWTGAKRLRRRNGGRHRRLLYPRRTRLCSRRIPNHPCKRGGQRLETGVVRLYGVVVLLGGWVRVGCARLSGVHEVPPRAVLNEARDNLKEAGQRIRATQSLMRSEGMRDGEDYRDLLTRLFTALAMTEAAYSRPGVGGISSWPAESYPRTARTITPLRVSRGARGRNRARLYREPCTPGTA